MMKLLRTRELENFKEYFVKIFIKDIIIPIFDVKEEMK